MITKKLLAFTLTAVMLLCLTAALVSTVTADTTYTLLWPVQNGKVSGYYKQGSHNGLDIVSAGDDTIYAARSGKVIWCENPCTHWDAWDSSKGVWRKDCSHYNTYGNVIAIQHDDGTVAIYGHLRQDGFKVSKNSRVEAGQPIALMGSSGMSDGKHLHFELRALGSSWGSTNGAKINSNPVSKGGAANYYYTGYNGSAQITPADITAGVYYLCNGEYRIYMAQEAQGANTIAASTATVEDSFQFNVVKDGSYYKVSPTATSKNYVLNCYWGKGGTQTASGNEITLWANDGDLSQRWIFEEYGTGYLIHPADRSDLSITRENNKLYVRETTQAADQIWELERYCAHSYNASYSKNDEGHWKVCSLCDKKSTTDSHVYANACDTSCNTCGYTRTTTHTYSNSCDTTCNTCGYERTVTHTYGSSYAYNNDTHWKTCSICGNKGTATSHTYSNTCDNSCNHCKYERSITHTYDNSCDTMCNVCGETRSTQHVYDNKYDATCNVCNEVRTVETLPTSTPVQADPSPEPSTTPNAKPSTEPNTDDTQSGLEKPDDNALDQKTVIVLLIAGAVTVSTISIFGAALVIKKKR